MIYYFGVQNTSAFDRKIYELHGNILFSYYYVNNKQVIERILSKLPNHNIIIDSGAFSAWSLGKTIDLEKLADFYSYIHKIRPQTHFINLDVIPGRKGRKPSTEEATKACQDSWSNYLRLKQITDNILPVFHEDDDYKYLKMMKNETDYIAISPANDSSTKRRMGWLDTVYYDLKADYKTHGLAATSVKLMQRYPFYSVDSVNYRTPAMYGRGLAESREMLLVKRKRAPRNTEYIMEVMPKEVDFYKKIERDITRLWQMRGVAWT